MRIAGKGPFYFLILCSSNHLSVRLLFHGNRRSGFPFLPYHTIWLTSQWKLSVIIGCPNNWVTQIWAFLLHEYSCAARSGTSRLLFGPVHIWIPIMMSTLALHETANISQLQLIWHATAKPHFDVIIGDVSETPWCGCPTSLSVLPVN